MRLLKSKTGDAIGIEINEISFRSLLRALGNLPSARVGKNGYNLMNDDAFASFEYKGVMFEIHTPLSDYWNDKPESCPAGVFEELMNYLEQLKVRWWHRII
jgi:hypothetical protein